MKILLTVLALPCLVASAFAGTRVAVPSLPEAVRPLAEVETNVVFDAGLSGVSIDGLKLRVR